MKWLQMTVSTTSEGADLVAMALLDLGSEGVSVKDRADVKDLIDKKISWDYVDESLLKSADGRVLVSGFYPENFDRAAALTALGDLKSRSIVPLGSLETTFSLIDPADWENEWRKYYAPIEIGDVVIVPAWLKAPADGKKPVFIEPGMAFGTGNHETTAGCLGLLQRLTVAEKTVLDVGCGSGILGIAAAVLGAKRVTLTDLDPLAIEASEQNIALNGVKSVCSLVAGDLDLGSEKADIVIANITADVLLRLCDKLDGALETGGHVILGGIIAPRYDEVVSAYSRNFEVIASKAAGDWRALLLRRKP